MPGMVRPTNKACRVAFEILGVPATLQDDKNIKKMMRGSKTKDRNETLDNQQAINVTYNP